jgi:F-type H+-transporting ATPase subunit a
MAHYNFFQTLTHDENWQKLALGIVIAAGLVAAGKTISSRLKTDSQLESAVIPSEKITLFGFFDFFVESFINFQDSILGKENRRYLTFTGSIFIFLLASNLMGLIPGMPAVTTTVWINVGLVFCVFVFFNLQGIKEHGLVGYLKHFCGPVIWLAPIIFPLEIISTLLRLLTLNLRLYWNITADHIVLGAFTDLTKVIIPVVFYAMGTFVAFMQSFVFTTLTMIYILLAVQHENNH